MTKCIGYGLVLLLLTGFLALLFVCGETALEEVAEPTYTYAEIDAASSDEDGGQGTDTGGDGSNDIANPDTGSDADVDAGPSDIGLDTNMDTGPSDLGFDTSDTFISEVWADPMGRMWQVEPTGGEMNWDNAKTHCAGLELAGYNNWRLPTISDLRGLIRGCPETQSDGDCGVTDECLDENECRDSSCQGCNYGEGPGNGSYWPSVMSGICGWYWSSSPGDGNSAWAVHFCEASVLQGYQGYAGYVRCVR